jgi:uroporphyrinogen-III synthase
MRVIVTRPAAQAADWVAQLCAAGLDAVALPLIGIAPADDAGALLAAWRAIGERSLVVFVSPNAAEQFFAQRPPGAIWPTALRAASLGPGTTRVLVRLGVPAAQVIEPATAAPQFDSESLWAQLQRHDWRGANVLVARGDGGRDWLAQTLRDAGATVAHVQAYRRLAPAFDAPQRALLAAALAQPEAHRWFFSSAEAIDNLAASPLIGRDVHWRDAHAIASHPRIAARARALGFGDVAEARPSPSAVIACIQSIAT